MPKFIMETLPSRRHTQTSDHIVNPVKLHEGLLSPFEACKSLVYKDSLPRTRALRFRVLRFHIIARSTSVVAAISTRSTILSFELWTLRFKLELVPTSAWGLRAKLSVSQKVKAVLRFSFGVEFAKVAVEAVITVAEIWSQSRCKYPGWSREPCQQPESPASHLDYRQVPSFWVPSLRCLALKTMCVLILNWKFLLISLTVFRWRVLDQRYYGLHKYAGDWSLCEIYTYTRLKHMCVRLSLECSNIAKLR